MGYRLSQIATRTGDDGSTGLGDNTRVSKDSLRVCAMGDVDELNAHIGLLLCEALPEAVRPLLVTVQHQLFDLGGALSVPQGGRFAQDAVHTLDAALALYNKTLPPLQEFILPAGTRAASQAHVCRTVARRAERTVVALIAQCATPVSPALPALTAVQYLNRLSDLLFVLARVCNRHRSDGTEGDEVYWRSDRKAQSASGTQRMNDDEVNNK